MADTSPQRVGVVEHYYGEPGAAIVSLDTGTIAVGDTLHFRGHTTDFYQRIDRIELDHQSVESANAGQKAGVHVSQRVREHDEVFKLVV
ncbi:MAG: translation elongation factor-like protein [Myxococcota bacterium]